MPNHKHILRELGILHSFSIARSFSGAELTKLENQSKKKNIEWKTFILEYANKSIERAMKSNKIPGVLPDPSRNIEEGNLDKLSSLANKVSAYLKKSKIDKYHCCYVINCMIGLLDLSEEDFDEFTKRFDRFKEGGDEESGTTA